MLTLSSQLLKLCTHVCICKGLMISLFLLHYSNSYALASCSMLHAIRHVGLFSGKNSPNNLSVFDIGRSGSATSQVPLLSSPEIAAYSKRRMVNRTPSTSGQDNTDSDLGSPLYTRYGAASSHQVTTSIIHH